ncbi:MAG: ABC transporter ATP-binding protein [Neomegalonema sp.]
MSLLEARELSVRIGSHQVVENAQVVVNEGEVVGLIGPNGAGKSSLLRALVGLSEHKGQVFLAGEDALGLAPRMRALRFAYLPQEREVNWPVSVETVVGLGRSPHHTGPAAMSDSDRRAIDAALAEMDLTHLRERQVQTLSGGERARTLTARALAQEAPLVIADEPTAALDPAHQIGLMETFRRLAKTRQGALLCLHDLGLAARWCDRIIVMKKGRIVAEGSPARVMTAGLLSEVYGVSAFVDADACGPLVLPTGLASASAS